MELQKPLLEIRFNSNYRVEDHTLKILSIRHSARSGAALRRLFEND